MNQPERAERPPMAAPSPQSNAMYSREETSPDGTLHIGYNYVDGERSPLIIEPRVTVKATGEVLIDLWRCSVNGSIYDFSPGGFLLKITDPYGPTEILARVATGSRTFTVTGDPGQPKPLSILCETLLTMVDRARQAHRTSLTPPPLPQPTFLSRLKGWLTLFLAMISLLAASSRKPLPDCLTKSAADAAAALIATGKMPAA
jgi:hypothetical protein